jgi:hypothetical protein
MLYMLEIVLDRTGSTDLTDILSGGEYMIHDSPSDQAYWNYWQEALDKLEKDGPPPLKEFVK